ncbi:unnamed protein product [Soboliphyme baturini]|uniref:Tropomodulin n=1 Tax=Soboliphyme baturini TaxID=241478 RepID=A0A183IF07_9BILA|nr:unnamed protein product [Soboliphyme baturini]
MNSLLPPSQRCRDQTTKGPTGPYNREKLLKFLEEKAKNEKDWEEKVPYQPGVKRGKVFVPKEEEKENVATNEIQFDLENEKEFELALSEAGESDLIDLAGILGMHSMISQAQYYNAVKGKPQEENEKTFSGEFSFMSSSVKMIPDEPPNDTDVADCMKRLRANDSTLKVVNVNNMKLIAAAKESSSLETFSLANTALKDADAKGLIDLLKSSKSLKNLNVESNYLTGEMLASLLRASLDQQVLIEFHAENQRSTLLGVQVEMELAKIIEESESLLRARYRVAEALESNYERGVYRWL